MTNKEKILEANRLIKEVLLSEFEKENGNNNSLSFLDGITVEFIVEHWYIFREKEVFINDNGEEIDEFLNIEEYTKEDIIN